MLRQSAPVQCHSRPLQAASGAWLCVAAAAMQLGHHPSQLLLSESGYGSVQRMVRALPASGNTHTARHQGGTDFA